MEIIDIKSDKQKRIEDARAALQGFIDMEVEEVHIVGLKDDRYFHRRSGQADFIRSIGMLEYMKKYCSEG